MKYNGNENHLREKIINTSEENNKQIPIKKAFQLTRTKSLNSAHCCTFIYLCNEDTCIQIHVIWSTTLNNVYLESISIYCIHFTL